MLFLSNLIAAGVASANDSFAAIDYRKGRCLPFVLKNDSAIRRITANAVRIHFIEVFCGAKACV